MNLPVDLESHQDKLNETIYYFSKYTAVLPITTRSYDWIRQIPEGQVGQNVKSETFKHPSYKIPIKNVANVEHRSVITRP